MLIKFVIILFIAACLTTTFGDVDIKEPYCWKMAAVVPLNLETPVSTKCDPAVIQQHMHAKTKATNPLAKVCPDGTRSSMFAPLYESCNNIETDYTLWNQGQRVLDVCTTIPRGEPIAFFLFGNPAGLVGMFWSCLPGNSFQIAIQDCGSALRILDIAAQPAFDKNNFYMFSW